MSFGERLKIAMETRGKKAIDIATNCGIDKGSISHYLKDEWKPKQEKLFDIAKYLNVDVGFLLGLQDNICGREGKITNSLLPTKEEIKRNELLREIREICSYEDNTTLEIILTIVKSVAKNGNK